MPNRSQKTKLRYIQFKCKVALTYVYKPEIWKKELDETPLIENEKYKSNSQGYRDTIRAKLTEPQR